MKISASMVMSGLFLLGMAVGTMELNSNRFSMFLGITLAVFGLAVLFFSEEQHRNPAWLKRYAKHLIWKFWPIGL